MQSKDHSWMTIQEELCKNNTKNNILGIFRNMYLIRVCDDDRTKQE